MQQRLELWHLDRHYDVLANFAPLKVRSFLEAQ